MLNVYNNNQRIYPRIYPEEFYDKYLSIEVKRYMSFYKESILEYATKNNFNREIMISLRDVFKFYVDNNIYIKNIDIVHYHFNVPSREILKIIFPINQTIRYIDLLMYFHGFLPPYSTPPNSFENEFIAYCLLSKLYNHETFKSYIKTVKITS